MSKCKCTLSISVLGDGCRYCQPQGYIDHLQESAILDRTALAEVEQELAKYKNVPTHPVVMRDREIAALKQELADLKAAMGEPVAWYDGNTFYADQYSASICMADMAALSPLYAKAKP